MGSISASEANRNFSALLRRAAEGERVAITSRGRVVAEIGPPPRPERTAEERRAAFSALLAHLRTREPVVVEPWTREELYERDRD